MVKGHKRKGDGVEDNHGVHRYQLPLMPCRIDSAPGSSMADLLCTHAIVHGE